MSGYLFKIDTRFDPVHLVKIEKAVADDSSPNGEHPF